MLPWPVSARPGRIARFNHTDAGQARLPLAERLTRAGSRLRKWSAFSRHLRKRWLQSRYGNNTPKPVNQRVKIAIGSNVDGCGIPRRFN